MAEELWVLSLFDNLTPMAKKQTARNPKAIQHAAPANAQLPDDYIKVEREQFSVGDLLDWFQTDRLDLKPRFQRRPVWKPGAKSYFIDTILRGLPVPPLILRDRGTNLKTLKTLREVVDGQQRLRTLFSFVKPDAFKGESGTHETFVLNRAHQPSFPKAAFADLPNEQRKRILDYRIITHTFPIETEDNVILEVFARLNATGTTLNPQELRHAKFYGEFKTLCLSIATKHVSFWLDSGIFDQDSMARMREVEVTGDLVLTILRGLGEGGKPTLDNAYKEYDKAFPQSGAVERRFDQTIAQIKQRFDFGSAKRFRNRSLFFCLFAAYYDSIYGLNSPLNAQAKGVFKKNRFDGIQIAAQKISAGTAPVKVMSATERRLTHKGERNTVVKYLRRTQRHAQ